MSSTSPTPMQALKKFRSTLGRLRDVAVSEPRSTTHRQVLEAIVAIEVEVARLEEAIKNVS